ASVELDAADRQRSSGLTCGLHRRLTLRFRKLRGLHRILLFFPTGIISGNSSSKWPNLTGHVKGFGKSDGQHKWMMPT
ncbi:hypothetical protein, partial [Agrobacterium sp. MS2]|uniref:hypothetical protein n=1 Tax=Agrobacterium sp. MS2 TaxID=1345498 RepID=UPI001AEC7A7E